MFWDIRVIPSHSPPMSSRHLRTFHFDAHQKLPETSRNIQKLLGCVCNVSGFRLIQGRPKLRMQHPRRRLHSVWLAPCFFLFCYVSFAQGIVQYCALIMTVNNCRHQHQCHHHQPHTSYIFIKGTSGSIAFFNSFHRFLFTGRGANGGSPEKEALRS